MNTVLVAQVVNQLAPIFLSVVARFINKPEPTEEQAKQWIREALDFHLPDLVLPAEDDNETP